MSKCRLFQIQFLILGDSATQGKFWNFYSHLSLERVFLALKKDHKTVI